MDVLFILVIAALIVFFFGFGWHVTRPAYSGWGAGRGNVLYLIGAVIVIIVVLKVLGIF